MILNAHYRRSETETQLRTFVKENPDADHVGIGLISDILSPIWRGSLYIVIEGTDNDVELRINKLWKNSPSFKVLKRAGVTAVQINADDVAKIRPLLDGLKIVHEGRIADKALLAVLPLLK